MTRPLHLRPARLALLGLGLLAAAGLAPGGEAAYPGRNGLIAFVRGGQIWTIRPDGSGFAQLTRIAGRAGNPPWSPNGTKIAFDVEDSAVYVANANGSGAADISTLSLGSKPAFGARSV